LTTKQTIASTTPSNVKISSPISPKNYVAKIGDIFPKIYRISFSIANSLQICNKDHTCDK